MEDNTVKVNEIEEFEPDVDVEEADRGGDYRDRR